MASFPGSLEVRPFKVAVPDQDIADFKQLLRLSKIGPVTRQNTPGDPAFGVSREWVEKTKEYWLNSYDWRKIEARINSFDNFKATVADDKGGNIEMHFIALQSKKADAVPIVLLHGWPGNPLEFLGLLEAAQKKYKPEDAPYTFIVPSLPGYAFSSGTSLQEDSNCETMAAAVENLMAGLGYGGKYLAQGGDIGSFVARILSAKHSAKAAHLNFNPMPPPQDIAPESLDDAERKGLERMGAFYKQGSSYAQQHGQRPATIGLVLSTTPLALLIWIGEKLLEWVDQPLPLDEVLDHITLYWFTETFPRAIYPYRQFFGPNPDSITMKYYLEKPFGYSWFPKEAAPVPPVWVAKTGNMIWSKKHTEGGHFAAQERPQDLLQDIEEFVAAAWKS